MPELSTATRQLIDRYEAQRRNTADEESADTIHVDEVASKVAALYEKVRGIIEYGEEHTLRKRAIRRILTKRQLFLQDRSKIAELLVAELIRGGYLPNDAVPVNTADKIATVLERYFFVYDRLGERADLSSSDRERLQQWLFSVTVAEVDELIDPSPHKQLLLEFATNSMLPRIEMREDAGETLSGREKERQIAIAVRRAVYRLDDETIASVLVRRRYPEWNEDDADKWADIADRLPEIYRTVWADLHHKMSTKLYRACRQYKVLFLVLDDIFSHAPDAVIDNIENSGWLEKQVRHVWRSRVHKLRGELTRMAIYTTLSIFATKMLLAIAIEVPLERFLIGEVNWFALKVNVIMPPVLMLLFAVSTRPPSVSLARRVTRRVCGIIYQNDNPETVTVRPATGRTGISGIMVGMFYLATFAVSYGALAWGLLQFGFNVFSIVVFLFFFSLVLFTGVQIRQRASALRIEEKRGGALSFIVDSFSLPFLTVGHRLSHKLSQYNIGLFIDILIEMPLTLFVEFIEHWRTFLREKREEIR